MRARRVTVLGASGFLGRYMVKHLAADGATVLAVGRHAEEAGFLKPMGDVGQVVPVNADLRDDAALEAVCAGADTVVNCVGILYERGAQTFDALHARLPVRIAAAAQAAGARNIVHVSAIGADPQSPAAYGRSKAAGEADLRAAFPAAIVLRPSIVFGPEDSFFNRFAAIARLSPALPLIGGGRTRFQPVYVGDVAAAAMAALSRADAQGRIYELGGPEILTFEALMRLMLRVMDRKRALVPIPFGLAMAQAALLELLPVPPLTRDQVRMLRRDCVVGPEMPGLASLDIAPTALELILPTYLDRFRRRGPRSLRPRPA